MNLLLLLAACAVEPTVVKAPPGTVPNQCMVVEIHHTARYTYCEFDHADCYMVEGGGTGFQCRWRQPITKAGPAFIQL